MTSPYSERERQCLEKAQPESGEDSNTLYGIRLSSLFRSFAEALSI
jgi:hypothetical protein